MTCADCKWYGPASTAGWGLCIALPSSYTREADQTACSLFAAKETPWPSKDATWDEWRKYMQAKEEKTKIMPYNAIAHLAQRCGEFDARLSALEEKHK